MWQQNIAPTDNINDFKELLPKDTLYSHI